MKWPSGDKLAIPILMIACVALVASMGNKWYQNRKNFYLSGAPPTDVVEKIEPKHVPYDQIKPPAMQDTDALVIGSMSSTVGLVFFGDYADPASNRLASELEIFARSQKGRIRMVWNYLPKTTEDGELSFEAAVLSECSRLVNSLWPAHLLMTTKGTVNKTDLDKIASDIQDEQGLLYSCRKDNSIRNYIREKVQTARGDGIDTAPFVFVGTHVFPSQTATSSAITRTAQIYLKY